MELSSARLHFLRRETSCKLSKHDEYLKRDVVCALDDEDDRGEMDDDDEEGDGEAERPSVAVSTRRPKDGVPR